MSVTNYSKWDHIEACTIVVVETRGLPLGFAAGACNRPLSCSAQVSDDEDDTHPNVDTPSLFKWRHEARLEREKQQAAEKAKRKLEAEKFARCLAPQQPSPLAG